MSLAKTYGSDQVTWERVTGPDGSGYAKDQVATSTITGRVEYQTRRIRDKSGNEVVSRALFTTTAAVGPQDWLTLPDGYRAQPLDVRVVSGLFGAEDHREVYL